MAPTLFDTIMSGVVALTLVQGVILVFLLLKRRKGSHQKHCILIWLIIIAMINIVADMFYPFFVNDLSSLFNISLVGIGTSLAAPPLIYLYTDAITKKEPKRLSTFWWHLLPCCLFMFIFLPLAIASGEDIYQSALQQIFSTNVKILVVTLLFFPVQFAVYLVLSMLKLRRHQNTIADIFSDTERINLNWLRNVLICLSVICFLMSFQLFIEIPANYENILGNIIVLMVVILIYTLGYLGMHQTDIFDKEAPLINSTSVMPKLALTETDNATAPSQYKSTLKSFEEFDLTIAMNGQPKPFEQATINTPRPYDSKQHKPKHEIVSEQTKTEDIIQHIENNDHLQTEKKEQSHKQKETQKQEIKQKPQQEEMRQQAKKQQEKQQEGQDKYQKSALDKETSKLLFDDLVTFMQKNKPYLENNISLSGLAQQVKLSPNYLSQIINEQSQNNFFDFINRYRVNHVKALLSEQLKNNQKVNMIDTALASGFNSKSAFYNAFKKYEGMTPSQYKKSIS